MAIHIHRGLRGLRIARLLARQPELAKNYDLTKLGPVSWQYLLVHQPQFAGQCDKWDEIQRYCPQFVTSVRDGKIIEDSGSDEVSEILEDYLECGGTRERPL